MLDDREMLFQGKCIGLIYVEVTCTCVLCNRHIIVSRGAMIFFHNRSTNTASNARRHLDKALVYLSAFNILEDGDTVFNAVKCHIGISGSVLCHCLENTAGGREEARTTFGCFIKLLFKLNMFVLQKIGQFLKGENRIYDALVIFCLVFFCYARTDEYGLCVRDAFLDIYAVCLHRRHYICKILKLSGEVFLN